VPVAAVPRSNPAYRGQAIYSRLFLPAYDAIVYGFNSPYLWRCPLERLVAQYLPAESYDSIALTHILHCLPGTIPDKRPAFEHARPTLAPGGTFFGGTILGPEADHNRLGRATVNLNNRLGVMSNEHDTAEALDAE